DAGPAGEWVTVEGEQLDRVGRVRGAGRAPDVEGEGGLPVRSGGDEANRAVAGQAPGAGEECPDRRAPAVPLLPGRHAQYRVLLEQGDEVVEMGALPGPDVAL